MYRKSIVTGLVVFLLLPQVSWAATDTTVDALQQQLQAIQKHLSYLLPETAKEPLTNQEMATVIADGTNWLLQAIEDNGHFAYEYFPYEDKYANDDNIVRQAGALFGLGEIYRRQEQKDPAVAAGMEQALEFFTAITKSGQADGQTFSCIANSISSKHCRLGATSLALSGLLGYLEGKPEAKAEYEDLVSGYRAFILAAQIEAGGFRDGYNLSAGLWSGESPYSNGEALLALARVYQYEPRDDVKNSIASAYTYLRHKPYESQLYLWIMAALKDMQKLWPDPDYTNYAEDFTDWRMRYSFNYDHNKNYCAYSEGIVSAYAVLKNSLAADKLTRLRTEIDRWNRRHVALQLSESDQYRLVIEADNSFIIKSMSKPELALGGFLTSQYQPTERIDFTQHCLSSYVETLVDIDGISI